MVLLGIDRMRVIQVGHFVFFLSVFKMAFLFPFCFCVLLTVLKIVSPDKYILHTGVWIEWKWLYPCGNKLNKYRVITEYLFPRSDWTFKCVIKRVDMVSFDDITYFRIYNWNDLMVSMNKDSQDEYLYWMLNIEVFAMYTKSIITQYWAKLSTIIIWL